MQRLKSRLFKYIFLILEAVLAIIAGPLFALEQLNPLDSPQWTTRGPIVNSYSMSFIPPGSYYRLFYENTSNQNRSADGFIRHQLNVPHTANASFTWSYNPFDGGSMNSGYGVSFRYGSNANNLNNDNIITSTTNPSAQIVSGSTAITINAGNYYAKAYVKANVRRRQFNWGWIHYIGEGHIYNFKCNLSPTGLTGNLTKQGISLSWRTSTSPAVSLSKYNIYRSENSSSGFIKVGEADAFSTSYIDRPNSGNKTFYYKITDLGSDGVESPYSDTVSVFYPRPPYNLTAALGNWGSSYHVNLNWETDSIAYTIDHRVHRSTTSGGNYTHIGGWGAQKTYRDESDLVEGNRYYYVVDYSYWNGGTLVFSPYSEEASILYLLPPTDLTAAYNYNLISNKDEVVLNWNQKTIANFQNYKIYRSTTENGTYSLIGTIDNSATTTFTDDSVTDGATYYYKISCTATEGESALSEPVSLYIFRKPTNLTISLNGSNNPVLNWQAPSPANPNHGGYKVYRATSASGPFTHINSGNMWGLGTTYTDSEITLSEGDSYYYYVTAFGYDHETGPSNIANYVLITPPQNLQAIDNGGRVALSWTPSSMPLNKLGGYNLYRSTTSGGPYDFIGNVAGNVANYNDATALEGVTYYYVVRAYNIDNVESGNSNEADCTLAVLLSITVTIDSSVAPEIVLTDSDVANIPVNLIVNSVDSRITIKGYKVNITRTDNTPVQSGNVNSNTITNYTVANVLLRNGESYTANVEVYYKVNGANKSAVFYSTNSFTAITPQTMIVRDGWSGKDILYSFFENKAEANWDHDTNVTSIVKYEAAVGTTPYGNNIVDWHDIGLPNRIAVSTPELASGTMYYTSIRGVTQKKNVAVSGCSDGFIARRDPVTKDTDDKEFFNNARVLTNLSTANGKLTPAGDIGGGTFKYSMAVTITEPNITERVNAPCLVDFNIAPGKRPTYIKEFRVVDDQGNIVPRYNLTQPHNSTVAHPYIVFLVNLKKGESRTYYIYWGNGQNTEPNYGFTDNTNQNSFSGWTPYYSRKDMPAGIENVALNSSNKLTFSDLDDGISDQYISLSKFYFFGENRKTTWYLCVNGFMNLGERITHYAYNCSNNFKEFRNLYNLPPETIANRDVAKNLGPCICPLWVDHMTGTKWSESGVFKTTATNPNRLIYTWVTYRFQVPDDAYRFQTVLYETGDIAIRYNLINPRALISNGKYDRAVNTTERTVGISRGDISNGDNPYWLIHTPLQVGINQNPTAFYQCMNAFDGNISYGEIQGDGTTYDVAHFESMVFDTKMAAPTWTCMKYDASVSGARKITLYYRTGNSQSLDGVSWSSATNVTSSVTDGEIPITTTGRYIQYKAVFQKTGSSGMFSLDEVRFVYGGINIERVSAVDSSGNDITEVSQGQQNIEVKVSVKNTSSSPLNLTSSNLNFTLGGHTATYVEPAFPITILQDEAATLTYNVSIAEDAPAGECVIDAEATVSSLIKDMDAQYPLKWVVNSKSALIIESVYSPYTKVTKNHDYDIYVTITNSGDSDCMISSIIPTYASGTYTFTLDPSYGLATGSIAEGTAEAIIGGKETKVAKFSVHVLSESNSGSDTIGATASGTNMLSGELTEAFTTNSPHIWTIQKPAELNLYNIIASGTLYRGQKNNKIALIVTNEGEAELEWYPASSTDKIIFTPINSDAKSYDNKKILATETAINITSETVARAEYSIDVKPDTATGTDRITATIHGTELNSNDALVDGGTLPYAEWTIYAEKVDTYSDGAYNDEKDSFNKPAGSDILTVYAKVENLAANTEYMVHWYAPDGTEIERTLPTITAGSGYFGVWLDFDSTCQSGVYKIQVTDPLSIYICCENSFEIVAPAQMTATFTLPLYATLNQPIVASFTFINDGGAVITNATLIPTSTADIIHLDGGTNGNVTFNPDNPLEAIFSPRLSEVPGFGQATTTFKLIATNVGRVKLRTSASGYDKNSGLSLSLPNIQSNICTIQRQPNIQIINITKTSNTVFKNQKNIRVNCTLRNSGVATAIVTAASITFNLGNQYYEQELMGYTEPFEIELGANQSRNISFDISVNVDCPSGLDALTIKALWHDKNWPINQVSTGQTTWTIANCGIILSANPDFNYEQLDFYPGQRVYIRTFGVAPDSYYYRTRLYASQIQQQTNVPPGYIMSDQGYSGLLSASDLGYVDHIYTLPNNATIGTWSVTLDSCGTNVNTQHTTLGPMLALQYFRVQNQPHMVASFEVENLSIENNDNIFVGDTFKVRVNLTSTTGDYTTTPAVNTGAIDFIAPVQLIKDPSSMGNARLMSGPQPATFTLRAGETKSFEYIFKATEFTDTGVFRLKSSNANYIAYGRNRNLWDHQESTPYDVFAKQQLTSNGIVIYTKSMDINPTSLNFGSLDPLTEDSRFGLVCGAIQKLDIEVLKTGNYQLDNISLNSAFLNGPIDPMSGTRYTISDTYFGFDTRVLSNPLTANSEMTTSSLSVPFNQPEGEYSSTMFLYCDTNNNGQFDNGEVTAEFDVKVFVNRCKIVKIMDDVVDLGSCAKGYTTNEFSIKFLSGGNVNLTNAKLTEVGAISSLTPYINFTTPTNFGVVPIKEYRTVKFKATIPEDAPNGVYIATYTIYEDNDNSGTWNPSETPFNPEPYDTFQVRIVIGEVDFNVKNAVNLSNKVSAINLETSTTSISGQYPGFHQLRITNTSTLGMVLDKIKLQASDFDGVDKFGNHYTLASNVVEIYPGTLNEPIETGGNDIFDVEIYIAPGANCATYTSNLRFYRDNNNNNKWDSNETYSDILFEVYIKPTEKVLVKDKPVSITGMSSDIQGTNAKVAFLCHNLGNVPLKYLKFDFLNRKFIQKDVASPFEFPTDDSVIFDPIDEIPANTEFAATLTIRIPQNTPDGVYVVTALCKIYNDDNGDYDNPSSNGYYNSPECYDEFQIWLQIGEMELTILNTNNITGAPTERSTEGPFTVKNDGALTITNVVATASILTGPGGNTIPATASLFLPNNKIGTLKQGFESDLKWVVDIPEMTPAGVYTGYITAWSDTTTNEKIDIGEASATAEVNLTVLSAPRLSIRKNTNLNPADIDSIATPLITINQSVTASVRLYNTGNEAITSNILTNKSNLTNLSSIINASNITIDIEPFTSLAPGDFVIATFTVAIGPAILNSGHYIGKQEFYITGICSDSVNLDVEYGQKELQITPNPLIFNDLNNVQSLKVTATRKTAANLKRICVYERSPCTCGLYNCHETKITMISDQGVEVAGSRDFYFHVDVDPTTAPGWHIATWTFFDDDDKDSLYDTGEYAVDLQIRYYVAERLNVTIDPAIRTVTMSPGQSLDLTYTVTNTGNSSLDLNECNWALPSSALTDLDTGESLGTGCFVGSNIPTAMLGVGDSATYVITITIPNDQPDGDYGPGTMTLEHNMIGLGNTEINVKVIRTTPNIIVPGHTVYQEIASSTFENLLATQPFFVSAWVSPGAYDEANIAYANLSIVRYGENGEPKAALTARLGNRTFTNEISHDGTNQNYWLFAGDPVYEGITAQDHCLQFHKINGKPVYGISGDPVSAKVDDKSLQFYRIYFAFYVGDPDKAGDPSYPDATLGSDSIRVLLTHTTTNTASSTVYFDGIKFEKAFKESQDRPTTYHQSTTLISPSNALDMSGKHKYYEW